MASILRPRFLPLAAGLFAISLLLAQQLTTTKAASTPNQYIVDADATAPGVQSTVDVAVGDSVEIAWVVDNIVDPWQAEQGNMTFDSSIVGFVSGPADTNLGNAILCGGTTPPSVTGYVYWGCARLSGTSTASGTVRTMVLQCMVAGTSVLHLRSNAEVGVATGTNFAIVGDTGDPDLFDASINCIGAATATPTASPTPTETATAQATNTSTPTSTNTALPTETATFTPTPCVGTSCGDTDADGMPDIYEELRPCLDETVADGDLDPDRDGLNSLAEYLRGTDPCAFDTDGDMCGDGDEALRPDRPGDPLNPYDFYTVPVPALLLNTTSSTDYGVGVTTDVVALLNYIGLKAEDATYNADLDGNGVPDGRQYDRSVVTLFGGAWPASPDGGIGATTDLVAMLSQSGLQCSCPDFDGDGLCDDIDPDDDNDGMPDTYEEAHPCLDPRKVDGGDDADSDNLTNLQEFVLSTDPCTSDTDGDGLTDGEEAHPTFGIGTDPLDPDTDGDLCGDGREVHRAPKPGDPLNPWDFYSVPVPALLFGTPTTADSGIGATTDLVSLLEYVGMDTSSLAYIVDIDGNGVMDGRQYDRSSITYVDGPWPSSPDGGIGVTTDVQAMLSQIGYQC